MKYIDVDFNRPYDNFALEEYLLTEAEEDNYLFFYIHRPSIIVGAHQNTLEEINYDYVQAQEITVARRLSGGGAVYHDEGNLNFSFVKTGSPTEVNDFASFTKPIIEVLNQLGVPAVLSGRNDLTVEEKKFSGNASCYKNGRILSHGTLLFKANMEALGAALQASEIKLRSKGVASVRARVANLADYLPKDFGIRDLKNEIISYFEQNEGVDIWQPNDRLIESWKNRADTHFATWDWVWGKSPDYNIRAVEKYPCGIIDARLKIIKDRIAWVKFYGDFFTSGELSILEKALVDRPYHKNEIIKALSSLKVEDYFKGLSNEDLAAFLLKK